MREVEMKQKAKQQQAAEKAKQKAQEEKKQSKQSRKTSEEKASAEGAQVLLPWLIGTGALVLL